MSISLREQNQGCQNRTDTKSIQGSPATTTPNPVKKDGQRFEVRFTRATITLYPFLDNGI